MIIAVDGPSAAGKGTVARAIARELGYPFLDTGSLYRMVGLAMLKAGKSATEEKAATDFAATLDPSAVKDHELRTEEVAAMASKVAAIPSVRAALLDFQRRFARQAPGAVLDGRDIGTVVCPDADIKFFVTARPEVRARRRHEELRGQGHDVTLESVLADVEARDTRDAARSVAPTMAASDAIVLDTSDLDREAVLARVMAVIAQRQSEVRPAR